MSDLMSGEGKRNASLRVTAPFLDSTQAPEERRCRRGGEKQRSAHPVRHARNLPPPADSVAHIGGHRQRCCPQPNRQLAFLLAAGFPTLTFCI